MNFFKLKISTKALLFFLIVALLPLVAVSFVLVSSGNSQLLKAASTKQQIVAVDLAGKVDNYLTDKINQLVFQSKISTDFSNPALASQDLSALMSQNSDIESIFVLDANGMKKIAYNQQGPVSTLTDTDQSNSDAYKAAYFLAGKPYVSSVTYNQGGSPFITIAVPVLQPGATQQSSAAGSQKTEYFGTQSDVKSVIVASYNISDLWQTVLSTKIGQGGYAYVVDGLGNLVAHPNRQFLTSHQKIANVQAVEEFRSGVLDTKATVSETGQKVISTPRPLSTVGWAVIVEEPIASVYANVNSYIRQSAIVGVVAIALSILIAVYFSRQLTEPIKKLSMSAKKLGGGELNQLVDIKTNDELEDLADSFNLMTSSIRSLVSDLKSNNLALDTERIKLNRIINSVSDGVIALNTKGAIVSVNPPAAALVKQKPAALLGRSMSQIFPLEQDDTRFLPETAKPGLYQYGDLTLEIGNKVSYLEMVVFVLDGKDDDVTAIITIQDLTKSRELDYMKLDFVAIAAHELRTPLTVVRGYLDMLNSDALKQMTVSNIENLQRAIVGSDQLGSLINKLLNIAHIERGEMEIFIEKVNLTRLLSEIVHQQRNQAEQRLQQIVCNFTALDKPVYVPADASSITEVLNNLIGNAIKYTQEKGEIHVNMVVSGGEARVEVVDNGPGIPEELRARLFTKFYRAERSMTAGTRGTGLGLFISKTIMGLHNGTIGIAPDTGHGSTFYITLPVYKPELHDKLLAKDKIGGVHGWFKKRSHN